MTDLKPHREYLSDAQLDAIAALDVNLGDDASIQAADSAPRYPLPDWLRAANVVLADETDLHLEIRRLTPKYLDAREAFEETDTPNADVAHEHSTAREALVHVLVAVGAYEDDTTARTAVQALAYPMGATMLVERWVHTERLDTRLGSGEIVGIAELVKDRIAAGDCLDDLPMWDLADVYLTGGEL